MDFFLLAFALLIVSLCLCDARCGSLHSCRFYLFRDSCHNLSPSWGRPLRLKVAVYVTLYHVYSYGLIILLHYGIYLSLFDGSSC